MIVIAAVSQVANAAALHERRLVMHGLLFQVSDLAMAAQANVHRIRLRQIRESAGMRIMAVGAISSCARMLNLSLLDQLGLVGVASNTKVLDVLLRQHHFAIFGRSMAGVATLVRKRRMRELGHQLRRRGLMRVVALQAVRRSKRLVLVRLLQRRVFRIVAIETKRRRRLRQVKAVFQSWFRSGFVRDVAGVAPSVERRMTAAFPEHSSPRYGR